MGRWDYLIDRKPQELKDYVLDQVADRLTDELRSWPPRVDDWLDEPLRNRFHAALLRPSTPGTDTLRVACEMSRRELLRDYDLIDAFWRSGNYRDLLPDAIEETSAHFVTRFLVDAALGFQELAQNKFARRELVALVEKVEDRLLRGHRFRL
ncbi:MAG TPA: hypothetical protein VE755_07040 [Myxococcales bacterium]|nr:hypothetical protein [Myxococcales bacterium]